MPIKEPDFRVETVERLAEEIALSARTAPKAKGIDLLEIIVIKHQEIKALSQAMLEIGEREKRMVFTRDGQSILQAAAIIVLGTKAQRIGLRYCGFCGYKDCDDNKDHDGLCAFNPGDLGIAVGSVVSQAADRRLDNRVLYSVGRTAMDLGLVSKDVVAALGIPLAVSGKNPFFDRG